jgi:alpha 1,3-glucosidase
MRRAAPFRNPFSLPVVLTALLSLTQISHAVKHGDFKTCSQSGFCKRNRAFADQATAAGPAFTSPYELDSSTVKLNDGILTGTIWKTVSEEDGGKVELPVVISFLDDGVARLTVDEARRQKGDIEIRGDSKARKERYNEAEKWALVGGQNVDPSATLETRDGGAKVAYGPSGYEVQIDYKPFKVSFWRDNEPHVVFNDRHLMNIEHWRPKREKKEGEEEGSREDESTWWEETFGGNTDFKPKGE